MQSGIVPERYTVRKTLNCFKKEEHLVYIVFNEGMWHRYSGNGE